MLTSEELPHYSYHDYLLWEGRWELIEGIPYAMTPSPGFRHQCISQKIAQLLGEALEDCEHCIALLPCDWKVTESTVLQPDNMVICFQPVETFLTEAPALIFEVLSPSTAEKDRRTKYGIYEGEGVVYYCIVDPEDGVARIFHLQDGRYVKQPDVTAETVEFNLGKCQVTLDFARIWPDAG